MRILFFDTETTGFVKKNLPPDHEDQPRVVQLAAELCNETEVLSSVSLIVNPGKEIPTQASDVHGITTSTAQQYGVPPVVMLGLFHNLVKLADGLVAHNVAFDMAVLIGEYAFANREPIFGDRKVWCTMALSTQVCQLPKDPKHVWKGSDEFKWPNLLEAFQVLVDPEGFEGAHDALVDVRACRAVFGALKQRGLVR
jgi:DNA polymerase III subunit epsilon